jgi:hypothetical protein
MWRGMVGCGTVHGGGQGRRGAGRSGRTASRTVPGRFVAGAATRAQRIRIPPFISRIHFLPMKPGTHLCPELDALLRHGLRCGNTLGDGPVYADWPVRGAVFAALRQALDRASVARFPQGRHTICDDPRYGWHDACRCLLRGDLLAAGQTRPPVA